MFGAIRRFFICLLTKKSCFTCVSWLGEGEDAKCEYAEPGHTHCKECKIDPYSKWRNNQKKG